MSNWSDLPKPLMVLAPMADVTDAAFRRVIAKHGKPDVTWTEFVSADGLFLRPNPDTMRKPKTELEEIALRYGIDPDHPLLIDLLYTEAERPIIAQFFSCHPELVKCVAALARDLGYDGVDLNMGCPDKNVCKQGGGCGMIQTPDLAVEVINAAKEGAGDVPVSVKTRAGWSKDDELEAWITTLLNAHPVALTLHARTKKDMSKVPARWELIAKAVSIRDKLKSDAIIIGNGDVTTLEQGYVRVEETGCDGVMIGRGIFGNPWFFNTNIKREDVPVATRLQVLAEHTRLYEELLGHHKSFSIMKKHFKAYVEGFDGAKELRTQLMECDNAEEVREVIEAWITAK